jgi:hypothetical protein
MTCVQIWGLNMCDCGTWVTITPTLRDKPQRISTKLAIFLQDLPRLFFYFLVFHRCATKCKDGMYWGRKLRYNLTEA